MKTHTAHTPLNVPTVETSSWLSNAIALIEADYQRSADTHMIPLVLPAFSRHGIDLYLKDESTHPTGSLKHRLARSLFLCFVSRICGRVAAQEACQARDTGRVP
jgi:cysteine synthase A